VIKGKIDIKKHFISFSKQNEKFQASLLLRQSRGTPLELADSKGKQASTILVFVFANW
jgi:hypothetical protein